MSIKHSWDAREGDVYGCMADLGYNESFLQRIELLTSIFSWIAGHTHVVYGPLCVGLTTVIFESTPVYPTPSRFWFKSHSHFSIVIIIL
jgi:acetyl-CoA synthetase